MPLADRTKQILLWLWCNRISWKCVSCARAQRRCVGGRNSERISEREGSRGRSRIGFWVSLKLVNQMDIELLALLANPLSYKQAVCTAAGCRRRCDHTLAPWRKNYVFICYIYRYSRISSSTDFVNGEIINKTKIRYDVKMNDAHRPFVKCENIQK